MNCKDAMNGAKKWFQKRTLLQRLIIIGLALAMAIFWPMCIVREDYENRSGDAGHESTEALEMGQTFMQTFYAEKSYLKSFEFVLGFDPELPLEGEFLVELLDEDGVVIHSTNYPYNLVPDYRYCPIEINQWLKKGRTYQYRVTNVSVANNVPCVIYTQDSNAYAQRDGQMIFTDEIVQGEALSRYTWSVPLDWRKTLLYWGCMGIIACLAYELEEKRIRNK